MASLEIEFTEPRVLKSEDYIVPPDWAVRLVSTNFGKKCQKYPQGWVQIGRHTYPGMADDYYNDFPWGYNPAANEEHWQTRKTKDDAKMPVRGNLREEEYRFWNGSSIPTQTIATCRWCRQWAYGREAMHSHQSKTDHTRILREIYDCARSMKLRRCFACGSSTRHERWGIPLCNTNACLNKWRVAPIVDVSTTLVFYARYARSKGLLKPWLNEDGSEKANFETTPKPFNWERPNAY